VSGGRSPAAKEWRTLDWLPGYEVSEDGDVRNLVSGRILRGCRHPRGYRQHSRLGAEKRTLKAHRLVCEAWHGTAPEEKPFVAHNDGNPSNNHYTNLRWATAKENQDDRAKHGTHNRGERSATALLTWDNVREIRRQFTGARGQITRLSEEFGVSVATTSRVLNGTSWNE
jgi:hypothetical protein